MWYSVDEFAEDDGDEGNDADLSTLSVVEDDDGDAAEAVAVAEVVVAVGLVKCFCRSPKGQYSNTKQSSGKRVLIPITSQWREDGAILVTIILTVMFAKRSTNLLQRLCLDALSLKQ